MSRKGRTYAGDLAKPYRPKPIGLLASDEQKEASHKEVLSERSRRMGLLFDEHGVKHGDFESLCWKLAVEHVPGMSGAYSAGRGRPQKWGQFERALLAMCIGELCTAGLSITDAVSGLAAVEPWKSMLGHSRGGAVLRDEYTRLDEVAGALVPMIRDHRQSLIDQGEITKSLGEFARKYMHELTRKTR